MRTAWGRGNEAAVPEKCVFLVLFYSFPLLAFIYGFYLFTIYFLEPIIIFGYFRGDFNLVFGFHLRLCAPLHFVEFPLRNPRSSSFPRMPFSLIFARRPLPRFPSLPLLFLAPLLVVPSFPLSPLPPSLPPGILPSLWLPRPPSPLPCRPISPSFSPSLSSFSPPHFTLPPFPPFLSTFTNPSLPF